MNVLDSEPTPGPEPERSTDDRRALREVARDGAEATTGVADRIGETK